MSTVQLSPRDEERISDNGAEMAASTGAVAIAGGLLRTVRPHQWVKNLFVFAPVFFARNFFQPDMLLRAASAVFVFCLLSGAVYTLNDLLDVEADRVHPKKRHRPIASGRVPVAVARGFFLVILGLSLTSALAAFPLRFGAVALAYFLLNVAYSIKLKSIPFLDVGCLAVFFVLRVLGGGSAIGVRVSVYMIACTALLALFLGFGKRRHEIAQQDAGRQRKSLESYSPRGLDAALLLTGASTFVTYVAYTVDRTTASYFQSDQLWMTSTSVFIGLVRFIQIVRGHTKSESPTQEMLRDQLFVLNLVAWVVVVLVIVYRIRPTALP